MFFEMGEDFFEYIIFLHRYYEEDLTTFKSTKSYFVGSGGKKLAPNEINI